MTSSGKHVGLGLSPSGKTIASYEARMDQLLPAIDEIAQEHEEIRKRFEKNHERILALVAKAKAEADAE